MRTKRSSGPLPQASFEFVWTYVISTDKMENRTYHDSHWSLWVHLGELRIQFSQTTTFVPWWKLGIWPMAIPSFSAWYDHPRTRFNGSQISQFQDIDCLETGFPVDDDSPQKRIILLSPSNHQPKRGLNSVNTLGINVHMYKYRHNKLCIYIYGCTNQNIWFLVRSKPIPSWLNSGKLVAFGAFVRGSPYPRVLPIGWFFATELNQLSQRSGKIAWLFAPAVTPTKLKPWNPD